MLVAAGVVLLGLYDKKGVKFHDMAPGLFGIPAYVRGEEAWRNLQSADEVAAHLYCNSG